MSHDPSRRKTHQLCHQVADTLNQVLAYETHDDLLGELQVWEVLPAPDSSQLLVVVAAAIPGRRLPATMVLARLRKFEGSLRSAVAAAISRRRVPRLLFQFAGTTETTLPSGLSESPAGPTQPPTSAG